MCTFAMQFINKQINKIVMTTEKINISATILALSIGDVCTFPISSTFSVRTLACNLGLVNGRKFVTNTDRSAGLVAVKREA